MARAIWSGAISFGLVMVPVKVYSAVSRKDVRFNQLHGADGGRIQQKRVCSVDGEEVPYEEIVKGYEIEPGRYVTITPAELESVAAERTRRIELKLGVEPSHYEPGERRAPGRPLQAGAIAAGVPEPGHTPTEEQETVPLGRGG